MTELRISVKQRRRKAAVEMGQGCVVDVGAATICSLFEAGHTAVALMVVRTPCLDSILWAWGRDAVWTAHPLYNLLMGIVP
jgi:hypothetical protein